MAETHPGGGDRGGCLRGGGWGGEATLKTLTPSVKELLSITYLFHGYFVCIPYV